MLPCVVALLASLIVGAAVTAQNGSRSVWDGVYTEAQSDRGQSIAATTCVGCHGEGLAGGEASPLAGDEFMRNWSNKAAGELFERIRTSMPADRPGTLSRQGYADVMSYIFKVNGFPSGNAELASDEDLLRSIRIASQKP